MRRASLFALLVTLTLAPLLVLGAVPRAMAQDEGTPVPIRTRPLASAAIEILEPGTANIVLGRLVLAPGASLPFDPNDPSASMIYVQSGELTFLADAPVSISRAGDRGTPTPEASEPQAAGTEFSLDQDDAAIFPPNVSGEVRNEGAEEAILLVVSLAHQTAAAGTPTP